MTRNICLRSALTYPHSASRKNSTSKEKVSGGLSFLKRDNNRDAERNSEIVFWSEINETRGNRCSARGYITHFSRK